MSTENAEPCLFVVFGATGDLNRRKLMPALFELTRSEQVTGCHILGVARSNEMNDQSFRQMVREIIEPLKGEDSAGAGQWCDSHVHYRGVGNGGKEEYATLAKEIASLEHEAGLPGNRILYLALPPEAFEPTIEGIGGAGLNKSAGWTRIVVEKPFGFDLASSEELDALLRRFFTESQIYRIDHYLGKETVQNLMVFRFANPIFESLWNRDRIDNVQITVAEDLGVERRAGYYDKIGALRDMVQNHLTQVLTLIAMEMPATLDAERIRDEKAKVLHSILPIQRDDVVLGQYTEGLIQGKPVIGYRDEPGVAPDSKIETAAALKLEIANWRWQGVPFYLRTGKRMAERVSAIVIGFKQAPVSMFHTFGPTCNLRSNALVINLQPDEGFTLQFGVKKPGDEIVMQTENLHFNYAEAFSRIADAYETLLLDIFHGDQTLFVRNDWVELSWSLYDPLLANSLPLHSYASGTWGPSAADQLLWKDGRSWFHL